MTYDAVEVLNYDASSTGIHNDKPRTHIDMV